MADEQEKTFDPVLDKSLTPFETLEHFFPDSLRELPPERIAEYKKQFDQDGNSTLLFLAEHRCTEEFLQNLKDKLAADHLHLGKLIGAGGLALVFAVKDDNGDELKGVVARVENGNYGKVIEDPLLAPILVEEDTAGSLQKKHTQYKRTATEIRVEGGEMNDGVELHVKIIPRGLAYRPISGDPRNPQLEDEMRLNGGQTSITREEYMGNVLRTLGYLSTRPNPKVLVNDFEDSPNKVMVGGVPFKPESAEMLNAIHDISARREEGGFLALPKADGTGVISVNGKPLLFLTDVSSSNEVIPLGMGSAADYLNALPEDLAKSRLSPQTGDEERFTRFRDKNFQRGVTEKADIDSAFPEINALYQKIRGELLTAGVPMDKITMPSYAVPTEQAAEISFPQRSRTR
jgi:hypothetical protein